MPERGAVGDGVVQGHADEYAVGEFSDLHGQQGEVLDGGGVGAEDRVERMELRDHRWRVDRGDDVGGGDTRRRGVHELGVLTGAPQGHRHGPVAALVGGEPAGERVEPPQGERERGLEGVGEDVAGERRVGQEDALLDVVGADQA